MLQINFKQDVLPHLVAVVVFIGITVAFYHPAILNNKEIYQNDVQQGIGAGQEIIEFRESTGEEALWTNSMFSGMPAYLINTQWSGDVLKHVYSAITLGLPSGARHTFMAMICFYILLMCFGVKPVYAILGSIGYGFNTFNIIGIEAGHIWKVAAYAFAPLVLGGIHLVFSKKLVRGFVLTAFALAMQIRANHLQITYYLLLIVLIYGLFVLIQAIRSKEIATLAKPIVVVILAAFLGVGANIGKVWTAMEYGKYSTRGPSELDLKPGDVKNGLDRDYVFNWSHGIGESFTFLIPNYSGGASVESLDMQSPIAKGLRKNNVPLDQIRSFIRGVPTYHGDQPSVAGPMYVGAIICFLFILGIVYADGKTKYWIITATVFGLILSWGKNFEAFNYFMYSVFPYYNKFRSVSMAIAIPFLLMPLLGTIGLQAAVEEAQKNPMKLLKIASGVIGFVVILLLIGVNSKLSGPIDVRFGENQMLIDLLRDQRSTMLKNDGIRSLILIIIATALVLLHVKGKLNEITMAALMILIVSIDLFSVGKRFLPNDDFVRKAQQQFVTESEADKLILRDDGHYRVLNFQNPFNEARTSFYHNSIGGYHGAKVKRYQQLIENKISPEINDAISSLRSGSQDLSGIHVLNMLNAKYLKAGETANAVIVNQNALGNAWFADTIISVNSPQQELDQLSSLTSAKNCVIDNSKFSLGTLSTAQGTISLVDYKPNYLKYESSSENVGVAIFSEIYYPKGWSAFVDGNKTDHFRANFVLRAMQIPAGQHTIEFKFEPRSYYVGNTISMICSILIIIALLGLVVYEIRFNDTKSTN
ncbi:MAG: YfhO family protein [bacterium]|nr:YfhO family protein [bacterium]